jgi:hypothetical protein
MWFHRSRRGSVVELWNTVDRTGTVKATACWGDGASSTIHSPNHHYDLEKTKMPKEEVGTT